jgi:hypothetical protein
MAIYFFSILCILFGGSSSIFVGKLSQVGLLERVSGAIYFLLLLGQFSGCKLNTLTQLFNLGLGCVCIGSYKLVGF